MFDDKDIESIKAELMLKSRDELDKLEAFATIRACELIVLKKIINEYLEELDGISEED